MKINVEEIKEGDTVIIKLGIGNILPQDVDSFVEKYLDTLKYTFGCPISVIPSRETEGVDFSIIRNPNRDKMLSPIEHLKTNLNEIKSIIEEIEKECPAAKYSLFDLGKNLDEWDVDKIILELKRIIKESKIRKSALNKLTEEEKKLLFQNW